MDQPPTTPAGSELRRTRSLLADLDGVVWEAEAHSMTFTFVSDGTRELFGWTPQEWLANPAFWVDHLHPDDRQRIVSRSVRVATGGGRFDEEYRILAKDDTWVWVRDLGHAVTDADGKPATVRGLMVEITSRKHLETERADAEDRFRRVVERLPAIVYLEAVESESGSELPGVLLYVSPQVETILGFTPREWTEDPVAWARQFHPDDRAGVRRRYEQVKDGSETFHAEYRMYTRTGEIVWFRDEAVLVRDADGNALYWQGIMFDITAERRSAARVQETEDRYRALIEQLPAIVYSEDVKGSGLQLVFVNSRVKEVLGITPEEWLDDPEVWERAIHPDDREAVMAENARTEATGEPFRAEYRMVARDGRVLWFADEAVLVHDADGEPAYWQGVMLDITERREAQAGLAEAEARYRSLVEQNPTITYIDPLDDEAATLYISPQTSAILGYEPQEWYDDPHLWAKVVHPEDREKLDADPAVPGVHSSVYRLIARDGREVWVHDQAELIVDEDGEPRYWQGVLVDVTQQRRAEQLARDLEREREESERLRTEDELKTTFLQAVSHDLRTPLAAILGLAITLGRQDLDLPPDEARDLAERIARNTRRLDRIVGDLLDLERLQRGVATLQLTTLDLGARVREQVAHSDLIADRRLAIDVAPLTIEADRGMVDRIVENLVTNASKHTPGDSRIWVRVARDDDGEGALLTVEDDGPGVPAADREGIFEAFRQGAGASTGSGVGLALVRRFAELHGGRAWVDEREGGGASFRVWLPLHPTPQADAGHDVRTANEAFEP
jgi:PAS domain S-box-containing protein